MGEVNETNCCQWYKWCDNTNVTYQCTSALLTDHDAVLGAPGTWNATCKACGMCRDSQGGPAGMRKKAYLGINHAYQACIDTRRTVQTQAQIADPTRNQSVAKYTQIARDLHQRRRRDFVVCSTLNYKCLKQPVMRGMPSHPRREDPELKPREHVRRGAWTRPTKIRGAPGGRPAAATGMMVYDRNRTADKVADMHDRGNSTAHRLLGTRVACAKLDGDGLHASYDAQTQYENTSDPIGR